MLRSISSPKFRLAKPRVSKEGLYVLFSQAFVSALSFITSLLVGNICGADGLGYYALGFSIIVFAMGFHSALVTVPFTVYFAKQEPQNQAIRFGSSVANHIFVVALLIIVLAAAVAWFGFMGATTELAIGIGLLLAIPFTITREFVRRYFFANFSFGKALVFDILVATVQISSLCLIAVMGMLTPDIAIICIGIASIVGLASVYPWISKAAKFEAKTSKLDIRQDWSFGKWLLLEQVFSVISSYAMPWMLAIYLDSKAVGIFAACFTIAGLSNPFLQGIGNYLLPKFSTYVAAKQRAELKRLLVKCAAMTTAGMLIFCAVGYFYGEWLLQLFFRNPDYAGNGIIVALLCSRAVIGSVGLTAHYFLLAIQRPMLSTIASISAVFTMVIFATFLIPAHGLFGAALAWMFGTLVESIFMNLGYWYCRDF